MAGTAKVSTIICASIFGAFAFVLVVSSIGWFFHKRALRKQRADFDAEKQQLSQAPQSPASRGDYTRVHTDMSTLDVTTNRSTNNSTTAIYTPPTLPPVDTISPLSAAHVSQPPTRTATTTSRYSEATNESSENTNELGAFTIVNPQTGESAGAAAAAAASAAPAAAETTGEGSAAGSAQTYQPQHQQLPQRPTPTTTARAHSSSDAQVYVPYSQAMSPLARLSTSTLIPLQIQRTQSPENPVAVAGITSLQGSLHSTSSTSESTSNGSGAGRAAARRAKHRASAPPTIILETPSPAVANATDADADAAALATPKPPPVVLEEHADDNASAPGSPRSSTSGLGVHHGSVSSLGGDGSGAGGGSSSGRWASARQRSASGSSLPRYYSPMNSYDDVALRTPPLAGERHEMARRSSYGGKDLLPTTPQPEGASAGGSSSSKRFSSWGSRAKRPRALLRRSYGL